MAERTAQRLDHPTYYKDGRPEAQEHTLLFEFEQVQDSNIARRVAYYKTYQELKAISVQNETLQEMTTIENQCGSKT